MPTVYDRLCIPVSAVSVVGFLAASFVARRLVFRVPVECRYDWCTLAAEEQRVPFPANAPMFRLVLVAPASLEHVVHFDVLLLLHHGACDGMAGSHVAGGFVRTALSRVVWSCITAQCTPILQFTR